MDFDPTPIGHVASKTNTSHVVGGDSLVTFGADVRPALKPCFGSKASKAREETGRVNISQSVVLSCTDGVEGGLQLVPILSQLVCNVLTLFKIFQLQAGRLELQDGVYVVCKSLPGVACKKGVPLQEGIKIIGAEEEPVKSRLGGVSGMRRTIGGLSGVGMRRSKRPPVVFLRNVLSHEIF